MFASSVGIIIIAAYLIGLCFGNEPITVNVAIILPTNTSYLFSVDKCVPAIRLGFDSAYEKGILSRDKVQFKFQYSDSQCDGVGAPLAAFGYYINNVSDVFFGPCCDYSLAPVARYSTVWNKPVITTGGLAEGFAEKNTGVKEYKTLTRVLSHFASMSDTIKSIADHFHWNRLLLLFDSKGQDYVSLSFCYLAFDAIYKQFKKEYGNIYIEITQLETSMFNNTGKYKSVESFMEKKIGNDFAIIFLCASPDSMRKLMLSAHSLGYTNGEYVFFSIDLFGRKNDLARPWYDATKSLAENDRTKEAFKSVLSITLKKPNNQQYIQFSKEVKEKAKEEFPNVQYAEEEVNYFVGAFHDAVLLYAMALNKTLEVNGSLLNGLEVTHRMWNVSFNGVTGEVNIDDNGDRSTDYSLLGYNPSTDMFDTVGYYLGNKKKYQDVRAVYWPGGGTEAPPDMPTCGYDGSNCPDPTPFPPWIIVTIVFSLALVVICGFGLLIYRRYRQESELNSMTWRIRSEDIVLTTRKALNKYGSGQVGARIAGPSGHEAHLTNRRDSRISYLSVDSLSAMDTGLMGKQVQLFTQTAVYTVTNSVVALKSIPVRTVTVNRAFLMEIKNMKNLQSDHIVRFIGVSLDPNHEYIVTEYCQKGSLQDILENEQIKLDMVFKHSLILDVAKGMDYLHSSVIRYHGNLKSTNCVVDSRFVLKITDFGLTSLRTCNQKKNSNEQEDKYQICKRKLWTAPELLDYDVAPTVHACQKGDIYSFAIICQEVIYRMGVFYLRENETLSPEDVIDHLRKDSNFRPTFEDEDCARPEEAALVRRCWATDPLDRPDFAHVKNSYRRFMKQSDTKGGNLVDNLLSRMEQYANNLESLVEERTADYLEQKQKAEDLLYMMLPKSIAEQLVKGLSVKAEWFDEVTIYFSDICGFTALSAASSPMEVVALLNDLYTTFDHILEELDVYKVETIGDAYMVVSGLPNKNGINHAREIARMSLKLLEAVKTFTIRHKPDEQLKLRIGMHSGPVCAGVVGLKMPRYCLFGDTVNTASRMESNGEALKIHVSPSTKLLLDKFGTFELKLRGDVEMKGKGKVTTYWLLGERPEVEVTANMEKLKSSHKSLAFRSSSNCVSTIPEEGISDLEPTFTKRNTENSANIASVPQHNNNKPKHTTFKDDAVEFRNDAAYTPLLNGYAESNGDSLCSKV